MINVSKFVPQRFISSFKIFLTGRLEETTRPTTRRTTTRRTTTTTTLPTTTTSSPILTFPKFCFPSTAKVSLQNGKSVIMSELQKGDQVQTGMFILLLISFRGDVLVYLQIEQI